MPTCSLRDDYGAIVTTTNVVVAKEISAKYTALLVPVLYSFN